MRDCTAMSVLLTLICFFFQELASSAGEDVVFAMNAFIKRLLAVSDPKQMKVERI